MKEFFFSLGKGADGGLRREEKVDVNSDSLAECLNARPSEFGLLPFKRAIDPFVGSVIIDEDGNATQDPFDFQYPFPQLFRGTKNTILLFEDTIYEVRESDFRISFIKTYNTTPDPRRRIPGLVVKDITAGGVWHFADFGDVWAFFNGKSTIFKTKLERVKEGYGDKAFINDSVKVTTGTAFKGRTLIGGFDANFWDSWLTIWNTYLSKRPGTISTEMPMDSNFVLWSNIGGGGMGSLIWLFINSFATDGYVPGAFTGERKPLIDAIRRNDWGFMPMPWKGEVQNMKPLGSGVVVYGDNGVTGMIPTTIGGNPTFGLKDISDVGVANRGAVSVGDNEHLFIDSDGYLWVINKDLTTKRLGYQEFFRPFVDKDVVCVYDPIQQEHYLSSEDASYVLTRNGLCKVVQHLTGLFYKDNTKYGVFEESGDIAMRITTSPFDLGSRALGSVESVSVGADTPVKRKLRVAVSYRYKTDEPFSRTEFVPLNNEGNAIIKVSALEFMVSVEVDRFDDSKISNVTINFKAGDNRFKRGTSVSQATS